MLQILLEFIDASFHRYLDTNLQIDGFKTVVYVLIGATCLEGNIQCKC